MDGHVDCRIRYANKYSIHKFKNRFPSIQTIPHQLIIATMKSCSILFFNIHTHCSLSLSPLFVRIIATTDRMFACIHPSADIVLIHAFYTF